MGRPAPSCNEIIVYNSFSENEQPDVELSRLEKQLCHRAVQAYFRHWTYENKDPERHILFTGGHQGIVNEDGEIEKDNESMAGFVLSQYPTIPESRILTGVDVANIEENLEVCKELHAEFFERMACGSRKVGVVTGLGDFAIVAAAGSRAAKCAERKFVNLPVPGLIGEGEMATAKSNVVELPAEPELLLATGDQ